jgi:hypothetical protein
MVLLVPLRAAVGDRLALAADSGPDLVDGPEHSARQASEQVEDVVGSSVRLGFREECPPIRRKHRRSKMPRQLPPREDRIAREARDAFERNLRIALGHAFMLLVLLGAGGIALSLE